jgi:hypothetical protein
MVSLQKGEFFIGRVWQAGLPIFCIAAWRPISLLKFPKSSCGRRASAPPHLKKASPTAMEAAYLRWQVFFVVVVTPLDQKLSKLYTEYFIQR